MNSRLGRIKALTEVDVARDQQTDLAENPTIKDAGLTNLQSSSARTKKQIKVSALTAANAIFGFANKEKKLSKRVARKLQPKVFNNPNDWKEYMNVDDYMQNLNFKEPPAELASTKELEEEILKGGIDDEWCSMDGSQEPVKNSSTEPVSDNSSKDASNSENGPA